MEIEAKFRVPDDEVFERLAEASELGSFAVNPGHWVDIDDSYLDTDDYRVLAAGYFCRRRESREGIIMTFKSMRDEDGAVHRCEEVSVRLNAEGKDAEELHDMRVATRRMRAALRIFGSCLERTALTRISHQVS